MYATRKVWSHPLGCRELWPDSNAPEVKQRRNAGDATAMALSQDLLSQYVTSWFCDQHQHDAPPRASVRAADEKAGAALLEILQNNPKRLSKSRTNRGLPCLLVRRRGRSRRHCLTSSGINMLKVTFCPFLAISSDVGSTGSVRVLTASTVGVVPPAGGC